MNWNEHSNLKGMHAKFSPSQSAWIRYDLDGMFEKYNKSFATSIGTILHSYAEDRIQSSMKMTKSQKNDIIFELLRNGIPSSAVEGLNIDSLFGTLYSYVNDSISLKMRPEQILFYSPIFFGTTDAIRFVKNKLFIFDLKTGETPAHMDQLLIYAALFCLEYEFHPVDIDIELRIYQLNEAIIHKPEASEIVPIMDHIIMSNKFFEREGGH